MIIEVIVYVATVVIGLLVSTIARAEHESAAHFYSPAKSSRASVRHIERGGIGYNEGYTTFESFLAPDPVEYTLMPFADVRLHVFDDAQIAANVGVGLRKLNKCRVYGANLYYDMRHTKQINYNQMAFGLETLGRMWDFRINGYFPVGIQSRCCGTPQFAGFAQNTMLLSQRYQFAMSGFNAELAAHFGKTRYFDFYAAAGPYHFAKSNGPDIWGGKGRLRWHFQEYVTLELSYSFDKLFRNRFQCELAFRLPFGDEAGDVDVRDYCDEPQVLQSRMAQPVDRQEIIVLACKTQYAPAIDPATGEPFNFVFVDNTSNSQGTYESPYPTLSLAQANSAPGDIIYVFPGDGTTQGMNAGITLKYNQKFWGSATRHALRTAQGTFVIPAQSTTAPTMTNTLGNGIRLSRVNEVSGFTIANVLSNGIYGTQVKDITITHCTIDSAQEEDLIHLEYGQSASSGVFENLTLTNGPVNGLFIDAAASSMTCAVSKCTMENNDVYAINASFDNQVTFSVVNSTMQNNVNAMIVDVGGPGTVLVSGTTLSGTASVSEAPIEVVAGANPLSATVEHCTINDNTCGGIRFILSDTDSARLIINDNTITNNGTGSQSSLGAPFLINANTTTAGSCSLQLTGNTFANNDGPVIYCSNGSFNNFQITATDNTLKGNGSSGLVVNNPCTTFALTATGNSITDGGDHGITTTGILLGQATITITNNDITGNTNSASGVALSHDGTDLTLVVTGNDISDNEGSGIIVYAQTNIDDMVATIADNMINDNQNLGSNATGGIDLEQFTTFFGTIANNTLTDNVGDGLFIGSADASPSVCLTLTGNTSTTGYTLSSGAGTFNLAPCNVDDVNVGAINEVGTITPVQSCPGAVPCS